MGFIGFLTRNKRRFESRRCGFTPFAPLDSKRTENEHIRNICSYPDNVPATYRPDGKSAKKRAPSSRAWSLPPAVRNSFRLPSADNLRRFHRLIPPQAAPISNVPQRGRSYFLYNYSLRAKKELPLRGSWHGIAVTEGVRSPIYFIKICLGRPSIYTGVSSA